MSVTIVTIHGKEIAAENTHRVIGGLTSPLVANALAAYAARQTAKEAERQAELMALIEGFRKPGGRQWLEEQGEPVD